jgi:hypothetical protein
LAEKWPQISAGACHSSLKLDTFFVREFTCPVDFQY